VIFHLAGVVSGEAEANFDLGYRVNLDGIEGAVRRHPLAEGLYAARRLLLFDRRLWRAVPGRHSGRFPAGAAVLLRRAEADERTRS
jgi:hypothetical protein